MATCNVCDKPLQVRHGGASRRIARFVPRWWALQSYTGASAIKVLTHACCCT